MESIYTELGLYGSKNKCARTDTVFLLISEVCDGTVSLINNHVNIPIHLIKSCLVYFVPSKLQRHWRNGKNGD